MSTLSELRARLKLVVQRLARTPAGAGHVQWRDERQEQSTGVKVTLLTRSPKTQGTPELRTRFVVGDVGDPDLDPPVVGTEIKNDVCSQKQLTLQVLVECFDQTVTANDLCEQLRDRFYRPWTLTKLREVNCAVLVVEGTNDLPRVYDKRVVSASAFDVRLGWSTTDTQEDFDASAGADDVSDADTWIETVPIATMVTDHPHLSGTQTITLEAPTP